MNEVLKIKRFFKSREGRKLLNDIFLFIVVFLIVFVIPAVVGYKDFEILQRIGELP